MKTRLGFLMGITLTAMAAVSIFLPTKTEATFNQNVTLCHCEGITCNTLNISFIESLGHIHHSHDYLGACHEVAPVCGDGKVNQDSEQCDDGTGGSQTCTQNCQSISVVVPTTAKIIAQKVVCNYELDLPNWGAGGADITSGTATDWVATHDGCHLASDWGFEFGMGSIPDAGDTLIGPAGGGWTGFDAGLTDGTGMTMTNVTIGQYIAIGVREVLQNGYIPFSYQGAVDNSNNVSAEIYCHNDVVNYDNLDYVLNPVAGQTYYCVAFNALTEEAPSCGDGKVSDEEECDGGPNCDQCECPEGYISDGENGCKIECDPELDLVYNGGFEKPALSAGTWSIIPSVAGGWTVEQAGTNTPDGLEIQNSLWTPIEGSQYAELDGNLSTQISQILTTVPGQNYSLKFALSARPGVAVSSNGIEVYRNGVLVDPTFVLDGSANSGTDWHTYSYPVLATSSSSTLLIKDAGTSDTVGMFVDKVSVMCPGGATEPSCGNGKIEGNETCDDGNKVDGDGCSANCTIETCTPGQQLVTNGGFEDPTVTDASNWDIFPSGAGGWNVSWVDPTGAPATANLELQKGIWTPFQGAQYTELDSDWNGHVGVDAVPENGSVDIYQDLTTVSGATYTLSFEFSPRPGSDATDNALNVYWNGVLVTPTISADGSANTDTAWAHYFYSVMATGAISRLTLEDAGNPNAIGTFVDNVSVMCPTKGGGEGPICGNGMKESGEECDDGNMNNEDDCSNQCEIIGHTPSCGDGIKQTNEACDDGNKIDSDSCTNACTTPTCGDGIAQHYTDGDSGYDEDCDDGNAYNNDGCSTTCELDQVCRVPTDHESEGYLKAYKTCLSGMSEGQEFLSKVAFDYINVDQTKLDQCIIDMFCDDECIDTYSQQYIVYAYDNSLTNTPLITSLYIQPGDYLTVATDSTDTWAAGVGDRTGNSAGLIAGNPYGGNYGLYDNGTAQFPYGALVGRIYGTSNYFLFGTSYNAAMTDSGWLELMYWDSNYEDNSDYVTVNVDLEKAVTCGGESVCGNGVVDAGEACDDGNAVNNDSCRNNCTEPSGGGGQSCTVNCGGSSGGDGDGNNTPGELLRTGGDGDGDTNEPTHDPVTSTPLVFGPQSSVALQLPAMLAATGATATQSTTMWMVLFVLSCLGLGALASSKFTSKQK